ncbi:hypothetical protein ABT294_35010 [Nonomuraea sp. NPDC000554]|uniref:hypothetical protein n=1 Tax=Nonomuraea sp. NPDC000554 TaxID=3154259 RepID=UPI00332F767E
MNRHRIASAQDEQQPVSGPERARIRELERENAELREKLAFLKKVPLTLSGRHAGRENRGGLLADAA